MTMRTRNKKTVVALGLVSILVIAAIVIGIIIYANNKPSKLALKRNDKEWDQGGFEKYLLTKKMPTEIVWIGDWTDSALYSDETVRFENSVSHESLRLSEGYQRLVVVINELSDDLNVSREQYDLIFTYIYNNPNYYLMYFGKDDLPLLGEISGQSENISGRFLSMGFSNLKQMVFTYFGTYTSEEKRYDINPFDALVRWIAHIYEGEGL